MCRLLSAAGSDGHFTYDPLAAYDYLPAGSTATDSFEYTIVDDHGMTDTATATITITGVNDAETITGTAEVSVNEDSTEKVWALLFPIVRSRSAVCRLSFDVCEMLFGVLFFVVCCSHVVCCCFCRFCRLRHFLLFVLRFCRFKTTFLSF